MNNREQTIVKVTVDVTDGYHGWDTYGRADLRGSFDATQLRAIADDLDRVVPRLAALGVVRTMPPKLKDAAMTDPVVD